MLLSVYVFDLTFLSFLSFQIIQSPTMRAAFDYRKIYLPSKLSISRPVSFAGHFSLPHLHKLLLQILPFLCLTCSTRKSGHRMGGKKSVRFAWHQPVQLIYELQNSILFIWWHDVNASSHFLLQKFSFLRDKKSWTNSSKIMQIEMLLYSGHACLTKSHLDYLKRICFV